MAVKHNTVATAVDEEGAEVNKAEWNDDHVVDDGSFTIAKTTGLQTAIDGKIDDSQVLTDVPSGAVFTDTVYTHPSHTGDVTGSGALTISGGAVDIAHLSATGTADATTYLRGDNSWQTIAAGGATVTTQFDTIASTFSTTSTSFVVTGLALTLANRSGGKALITAPMTTSTTVRGSWGIFDDGVATDTILVLEVVNGLEIPVMCSHAMDLDGSAVTLRCKSPNGGTTTIKVSTGTKDSNITAFEVS
jgi:hypothetical protein